MTTLREECKLVRQRFRIRQDGMSVAWAEGPGALAEIQHYALVYGQDAPVQIEVYQAKKWRTLRLSVAKGEEGE